MALLLPFRSYHAEKEILCCWRKGILGVRKDGGDSNVYNFSMKRHLFYK